MKLKRIIWVALIVFLGESGSWGAPVQTLSGHVPAIVRGLAPLGRLPATNRLHLAIGLPFRNLPGLTNLLDQVSDPASPRYRQYLSAEEFARQFGPSPKDYETLKQFALAKGLAIHGTHPNCAVLDVEGTVEAVENAFQVKLQLYRHPKEARAFFAPDREPTLALPAPVLHISGLDNYSRPRPQSLKMTSPARPANGSGANGSYRGYDFRKAYAPGVTLTGTGQSVGLVEFDGYYPHDIGLYESYSGLPAVSLTNVLVDGFDGTPTDTLGIAEVSLDIELAIAMAPGLSQIIVYEAGTNGLPNDVLNRIATDNLAKQLSCSWSWDPRDATTDQIFLQFAAQGQSFFIASGDTDAYSGSVGAPTDSPYITVVGGTELNTGTNATWASESVWNWNNGQGSGGGISPTYSLPSWQQGINMTANHGSTTMRNIPDVAMVADNIWVVFDGGFAGQFGGTSCAAPLWASLTALINQQALANGRPVVGFLNPALYALAKGAGYNTLFHDTVAGNNTNSLSPTNYFAAPGYDLCTGWGSPIGSNLIQALSIPDSLLIGPPTPLMVTGMVGNVTAPDCLTCWLVNQAGAPVKWACTNTWNWLSLSPGSGRLNPGEWVNVNVCLNSNVNALPAGLYEDTLTFSNSATGSVQTRAVNLALQPINDTCVGATLITGASTTNIESTATATSDGDPVPDCFEEFGKGVWYLYIAPFDGYIQVDTIGSDFDTAIGLYTGTCDDLTLLACDDDSGGNYTSSLTNQVSAGMAYYILAGGYASASGNLVLHVRGIDGVVPQIITQPVDQIVTEGQTATFSVAADGTQPLSYYWWWNGVPIPGANGPIYTTPPLKWSNSGSQFGCLVSNAFGAASSRGGVVKVFSLPKPFTNAAPIAINDNSPATPYPCTIAVSGQPGTVGAVTATLRGLAHTFPSDIDILLVGPQGQQALLMSHVGGGQPVNNLTLSFDEQAADSLTALDPLVDGTFKPSLGGGFTNSFPLPAPPQPYGTNLGVFYGTQPNGNWSLYVLDDDPSDAGNIAGGWSLDLALVPSSAVPMFVPGSLRSLPSGQFQFTIAGNYGASYDLQVSTDLKNWKTLRTLTMTNDVSVFADTNTNLARRFYRTRSAGR